MKFGDFVFYCFIFFLIGVALAGFNVGLDIVLILSIIIIFIGLFIGVFNDKSRIIIFSLTIIFVFVGAFYYLIYQDYFFSHTGVNFDKNQYTFGKVVSFVDNNSIWQSFDIKNSNGVKINVRLNNYNEIKYGDSIYLYGIIKKTKNTGYFKINKIVGTMSNPQIISISHNNNFSMIGFLYSFRKNFSSVFYKHLSLNNAELMSGILLGKDSTNFSRDFQNKMKNSGTTHIVALSGYNVMILANVLFLILSYFLSRKFGLFLAFLLIIAFVLMTGAESSVVRAAIMWAIVVSAELFSRVPNFIRSFVSTAFVMVVLNPFILNFDVGFLLSFGALFGIVYFSKIIPQPNWGKISDFIFSIFYETLSAQFMVIPILIVFFEKISIVSPITNVLVLPIVPFIMGAGVLMAIFSLISSVLSSIFSVILSPLLSYMVFVINFFGNLPIVKISIGWIAVVVYYLFVVIIFWRFRKRKREIEYFV